MRTAVTRSLLSIAIAVPFLLGSSCLGPSSDYVDRIAMVFAISTPDSVAVGQGIAVEIRSHGTGCWRRGRDDVEKLSDGYKVTPYDQEYVGDGLCAAVEFPIVHTLELTTDEIGVLKIYVMNRIRTQGDADSIATLMRQVVVY